MELILILILFVAADLLRAGSDQRMEEEGNHVEDRLVARARLLTAVHDRSSESIA